MAEVGDWFVGVEPDAGGGDIAGVAHYHGRLEWTEVVWSLTWGRRDAGGLGHLPGVDSADRLAVPHLPSPFLRRDFASGDQALDRFFQSVADRGQVDGSCQ